MTVLKPRSAFAASSASEPVEFGFFPDEKNHTSSQEQKQHPYQLPGETKSSPGGKGHSPSLPDSTPTPARPNHHLVKPSPKSQLSAFALLDGYDLLYPALRPLAVKVEHKKALLGLS